MFLETSYRKAGFAGSAGNISNCYSRVNIHVNNYDESYVPEDYGFAVENGSITNSYSAGRTYHSFCNDNVKDCYYDKTLVTVIDRPATPATHNAMRAKATFENWDFENVWGSNDAINDGYPYLRVFKEGIPDTPDPVLVSGISLNVSDTTIIAGKSLQMIATVLPEEVENKKVIWTSDIIDKTFWSDEKFSIDENGLVATELGLEATVKIIATTDEGNYVATCTLRIRNPRIDGTHPVAYRRAGETKWKFKDYLSVEMENMEYMVLAYTEPDEANDGILWSTSDPEVLSITEMTDTLYTFYFWGNKVEHNCGRAIVRCLKSTDNPVTLEASLANGVKYESANINVRRVDCSQIKSICKYPLEVWAESPDEEMKIGDKQFLTVEIDDYISYPPTLKWSSSDPNVLSVDETGLMTTVAAVAPGTATITVTTTDGTDLTATCEVRVAIPDAIRGDVNGDRIVNGTDIQAIINLIVEGKYDEKGDVNEDGTVNGTDIQEVINIIVNAE